MSAAPTIELNNRHKLPVLGLGTWQSTPGDAAIVVKEAIKIGYRHFDGARFYMNEGEIGQALKEVMEELSIKREEIFITSKLWNSFHRPEHVRNAFEYSRQQLQLDYLDLYLIHWPQAYLFSPDNLIEQWYANGMPMVSNGRPIYSDDDYLETWKALEELVDEGLIKSIGVSNFNIQQLRRLLDNCRIKPVVNQIEVHPRLNNETLIKFCQENNIVVIAYAPLGSNAVPEIVSKKTWSLMEDEIIKTIAKNHNKTPAQVLLRFAIDRGLSVIPKSANPQRLKSNFDIFDFKLTDEEVQKILNGFPEQERIIDACWDINNKFYPFHED